MKTTRITLAVFGVAACAVLFNNCGQVQFSPVLGDKILSTLKACSDAEASGKLQTLNSTLQFADTKVETGSTTVCSVMPEGNFPITDNTYSGKTGARYEQKKSLNLPAGAVLCDVELENKATSFVYDDMIYMTFNGYVIASNDKRNVESKFQSDSFNISASETVQAYRYDWLRLRGTPISNDINNYCLGSDSNLAACQIPQTETTGSIQLSWDPKLLIGLAMSSSSAPEFKVIVTGDNNPTIDCYHDDLTFTAKVKYFIP